jgi:RNA polymerase sigma-70 factor (ECF subfamily)
MSDWLVDRFRESRPHLHAVAERLLGSSDQADDAVQEAWIRLCRSDAESIHNLGGWLTTVVSRVCLDMLRAGRLNREQPLEDVHGEDPEAEGDLAMASALGPALLLVLDSLSPPERVAFVLHDVFDLSFEDIARIVDRTPEATRKLASRARQRVRGSTAAGPDRDRQRDLVNAFLAASRDGDFAGLLALLAPDAVLRADDVAVRVAAANRWGGAPDLQPEVHGAQAVAEAFRGRARGATPAVLDGQAGAIWSVGGRVRSAFVFRVDAGRVTGIDIVMEPSRLAGIAITRA